MSSSSGSEPPTSGWGTVKVPTALIDRVNKRLPGSDFKSVDEYVGYVLDQVLTQLEKEAQEQGKSTENVYSKEDQASVEQRLRDLGYM